MAKKDEPKAAERIVYKEPPKKSESGGGTAGALIGLIGLLVGAYPLLQEANIIKFSFVISELWIQILLVIASLYLIIEAGKRQAMIRAKKRFDNLIH